VKKLSTNHRERWKTYNNKERVINISYIERSLFSARAYHKFSGTFGQLFNVPKGRRTSCQSVIITSFGLAGAAVCVRTDSSAHDYIMRLTAIEWPTHTSIERTTLGTWRQILWNARR
jgi:hypothetical protein